MKKYNDILGELGFSEKETTVYLALLSLGPSSVRKVAEKVGINRGTTHDALRHLQKIGVVSYYHKTAHQYFVAEDPAVLKNLVKRKKESILEIEEALKEAVPELRSLYSEIKERPVVKYYEEAQGVRTILQNVLDSVSELKEKTYRVYSSANIRPHLYGAFSDYTEERIKRGVSVRAISIGPGGKEAGLDERRWLTIETSAPTYTLIYAGKLAMISVDKKNAPRGAVIEDGYLFETQTLLFDWIWKTLAR